MNLIQKLAEIRREVEGVDKKGKNTFQNYKYVMASDIAAVIGTKLAERNIMIARRNLKVQHIPPGEGQKNTIVLMECEYGFIDGDDDFVGSDEQSALWMPAWGEGRDTGDKAGYKAFTGMLKYFLLQAFLLATGDDPEADSPEAEPAKKGKLELKADPPKSEPKVPATATEINEILDLIEQTQTDMARLLGHYGHVYDPAKDSMANFLGRFTKNNYTAAKEALEKKVKAGA